MSDWTQYENSLGLSVSPKNINPMPIYVNFEKDLILQADKCKTVKLLQDGIKSASYYQEL